MSGQTSFTERELDIMSVLWQEGSGTVAEVQDELSDTVGYTTVLKMLQILEVKGMVRHEREGRAYRYFPTVANDDAGRDALRRIARNIEWNSSALRPAEDAFVLTDDRAPVERLTDEGVSRESRALLSE